MVCVKEPGSNHDFNSDPIAIEKRKGVSAPGEVEVIGAKGTSLGADNGVGAAMMLACAEDPAIENCPPISSSLYRSRGGWALRSTKFRSSFD